MATARTWNKRREAIRTRVSNPEGGYPRCVVLDCDQPTMAYARQGLNRHYCRRHVEHYRRHGSYSKASYPARELNPRRRVAYEWLKAHLSTPEVQEAEDRVRTLYWRAPRPEEAFRLAGRSPSERARNIWGQLYKHRVEPAHVLAVWLAVQLRHSADFQPERRIEYRRVQAAKVLHRLAGGSHKKWEREKNDGTREVAELHKYPASRGLVLRHVGRMLNWAADPIDHLVAALESELEVSSTSTRAPSVRARRSTDPSS